MNKEGRLAWGEGRSVSSEAQSSRAHSLTAYAPICGKSLSRKDRLGPASSLAKDIDEARAL
jgi:hypothetical protein